MSKMNLLGTRAKRGERMQTGKGWRLVKTDRAFKASLLTTYKSNGQTFAVFRVLPLPDGQKQQD